MLVPRFHEIARLLAQPALHRNARPSRRRGALPLDPSVDLRLRRGGAAPALGGARRRAVRLTRRVARRRRRRTPPGRSGLAIAHWLTGTKKQLFFQMFAVFPNVELMG